MTPQGHGSSLFALLLRIERHVWFDFKILFLYYRALFSLSYQFNSYIYICIYFTIDTNHHMTFTPVTMPPLGTVFIDGGNLTANQWVTSSTPETVVTFEDFNFQFHCNVTNDHLAGILPLISPANTLDVQTSLQSSIYLIAFKLYSSSIQSYCQGTIQSDEITPEIHHKNIQKNSTKPFRHSIHCPRMIKIKTGSIFWRLLFLPLEGETPSVLGLA